MKLLRSLLKGHKGAAITEYALLVALIAVAVIAAIMLFRDEIINMFAVVADALTGV